MSKPKPEPQPKKPSAWKRLINAIGTAIGEAKFGQ